MARQRKKAIDGEATDSSTTINAGDGHSSLPAPRRCGRLIALLLLAQLFVSVFLAFLAGVWHHTFGVFVGLLTILLAACSFMVTFVDRYRAPARWMSRLLLAANFALALYTLLLFAVHFVGPDHVRGSFPVRCARTTNCVRLTPNVSSNVNADGLELPVLASDVASVSAAIQQYLLSLPRTTLLAQTTTTGPGHPLFLQFRTVSLFFGFPDDTYVQMMCSRDTNSVVLALQAEARVGVSDFGVNRRRLVDLLNQFFQLRLPPNVCTAQ